MLPGPKDDGSVPPELWSCQLCGSINTSENKVCAYNNCKGKPRKPTDAPTSLNTKTIEMAAKATGDGGTTVSPAAPTKEEMAHQITIDQFEGMKAANLLNPSALIPILALHSWLLHSIKATV